ncbi:hypothetical protein AMECASPLE_035170 [Ameca splendens]|uniref:Uncharacterized protein n=1 Tax=Ameca splendens TaxID=208324 RepID=A0ABV1A3G5_9TELE
MQGSDNERIVNHPFERPSFFNQMVQTVKKTKLKRVSRERRRCKRDTIPVRKETGAGSQQSEFGRHRNAGRKDEKNKEWSDGRLSHMNQEVACTMTKFQWRE